ncbi:MAG: tyrosine-protein phosphatase [Velocimicrobium sp.]
MKEMKKFIAVLLVVVLACQIPFTAKAADVKTVTGTVQEVQKYGNLTMDIKAKALYDAGFDLGDMLKVTVGDTTCSIPFGTSYSDVDTGNLIVRDSKEDDLLIVAINMGNFSTTYNVGVGDKVTFELEEKEGYLSEYLLRQLKRTDVRSDYKTDSIFANFRSVATTGIKPGILYRSASPINNEIGRAAYANELAKAVGIKTVVNLADSASAIKKYIASDDFNSEYYKSLYDAGSVDALDMGVDLSSKEFGAKLAKGLRFMTKNEAPYLVHCTEGKDRAGFTSAVLEALMGASLDEIVADYMTTYENYYGVEEGSEQYSAIANSNIVTSLTTIVCGYDKGTNIKKTNLSVSAENYLLGIGMTQDEIKTLKSKLSTDSVYSDKNVTGTVTEIEKYGHTSTDITIKDFYKMGFQAGDMVAVVFDNGFVLEAPFLDGYYVDNGDPLVRAYPGQENIAVCINYGKLFEIAKVEVGDKVTIMMSQKKGYLNEYEIRKLERTNNREDYSSDAIFANFRTVTMGSIAKNVLYRSSSPVNNELGRAAYADALIKKAKIKTVVNLADSKENIESYFAAEDYNSPYYKGLYRDGSVITLNMGLAYSSDEFKEGVIEGLKFMAVNKGPYVFHCTEGKDRTGFYAALLGSLMGATKNEIVEDYMTSYQNYYQVKKGWEQYSVISEDVVSMLKYITGSNQLTQKNLTEGAKAYLVSGGMTNTQIKALMTNLSTSTKKIEKEKTDSSTSSASTIPNYVVIKGDCLWTIAEKQLGDGTRYIEIYQLNKKIIKDPDELSIGQLLFMPKA